MALNKLKEKKHKDKKGCIIIKNKMKSIDNKKRVD